MREQFIVNSFGFRFFSLSLLLGRGCFPACLAKIQGFICLTPRPYHWGQGGVQAGLRLAVICVTVLVAAAVVDEADLEVHPALQPAGKDGRREEKSRAAIEPGESAVSAGRWSFY